MQNRARSKSAAITQKVELSNNADRKARTRTLIQLGGMVSLSGITSFLGIEEGDDLQSDFESKDKAAILLGGLCELVMMLESSPELKSRYLEKGINLLKTREYGKELRSYTQKLF